MVVEATPAVVVVEALEVVVGGTTIPLEAVETTGVVAVETTVPPEVLGVLTTVLGDVASVEVPLEVAADVVGEEEVGVEIPVEGTVADPGALTVAVVEV